MTPTVAVVVPTHRRSALLGALLDSLDRLDEPPQQIVVVIDGPDAATERVVARHDVTVLRTPGVGPAAARNLGWRAVETDVVAFVDDDCIVDTGWLGALARCLAGDETVGLAQGTTLPTAPPRPGDRTIHITRETGLYESCNIAYRRQCLVEVDGFDERFAASVQRRGRWFGEDTELAWRVKRAGWQSAFTTDAVVRHHVFAGTARSLFAEEWRRQLFPPLVDAIPELRDHTPSRWTLRPHSASAQAALAGVALSALLRRPAPLALALPYLRWAMPNTTLRRFATRAALDLTGSAALLVGSARARRVLL